MTNPKLIYEFDLSKINLKDWSQDPFKGFSWPNIDSDAFGGVDSGRRALWGQIYCLTNKSSFDHSVKTLSKLEILDIEKNLGLFKNVHASLKLYI